MTTKGKLVEYLDGGKFICALVTDDGGKRLRLFAQNGREVNLTPSRIIISSNQTYNLNGSSEERKKLLQDTAERRRELTADLSLDDVWEIVCEEELRDYSPGFLAELFYGDEPDDDQAAAFLRAVFNDRLFFKYKNGTITAHSPEQVEQIRRQQEIEAEKERILETGAKALAAIMAGEEISEEQWPEKNDCLAQIEQFVLDDCQGEENVFVRNLLKNGGLTKPNDGYHLLVKTGVWTKDENIGLRKSDHPVEFSEEAATTAAQVAEPTLEELLADPKRQDFSELNTFTIDGAETRDYDDALHVEIKDETILVGIHISDVAYYVPTTSPLYEEAMERATTLYFADDLVPMLPENLSRGVCSLILDRPRPVMSFLATLSPEGELLRYKIVPAVIKVKRQLTYTHVDEIIEQDHDLNLLNKLRMKLQQRRLDNGALMLPFPDVNLSVSEAGKANITLSPVDTPARTLVSELMILANNLAASHLSGQQAPALYRSQPPPRKRVVTGADDGLFTMSLQRRFLSRGELSTSPKPHSGLGLNCYTTITSPIRRFLDLAMQHQLNAVIRREAVPFNDGLCREIGATISRNLARANAISQQRHRYWLLRYLEERIDQKVNALVISRGPKLISLLMNETLLQFELPPNSAFPVDPGDMVKVRVARASALDNVLRMEW